MRAGLEMDTRTLRPGLPVLPVGTRDSVEMNSVASQIRARCGSWSAPEYFGADLRAAFHASNADTAGIAAQAAIFSQIQIPVERVFFRISPEPTLLAHWQSAKDWSWNEANILALASSLLGTSACIRDMSMATAPDVEGRRTLYANPNVSRMFISRLLDGEYISNVCPLTWSMYCYVQIALSHPLVEGNGRLARAILICALGRCGILDQPWLPVTAAFYRNAAAVVEAMHAFNRDLPSAQRIFAEVLQQSLKLEIMESHGEKSIS